MQVRVENIHRDLFAEVAMSQPVTAARAAEAQAMRHGAGPAREALIDLLALNWIRFAGRELVVNERQGH